MAGMKQGRDGAVGILTLNEPESLNAMTPDLLGALAKAVAEMTADPSIRALVLTGEGRGFCSGQNLKASEALGQDIVGGVMKFYWPAFKALRECRVPIVVAVNGVAAGGGFSLAMAGDMIVAAQPIQHTARPAPLAHVKGAYGVYVTGTSMEPEFRPGDILLVNPHLPVNPNEPYIFYAEHPVSARATIKWLRRVTDDRFLVTQHNPPPGVAKDLSLARKDWQWAHRVIGKYSRR